MKARMAVIGATLAFAMSACLGTTEPLPLAIAIEASRVTATAGDSINFLVTTQGKNLIGVEIDFGDGSGDNRVAYGARRATLNFLHAYLVPGTYQVDAKVTDSDAASMSATIQVIVN